MDKKESPVQMELWRLTTKQKRVKAGSFKDLKELENFIGTVQIVKLKLWNISITRFSELDPYNAQK